MVVFTIMSSGGAAARTIVNWWTVSSFFVTEAEQTWIKQFEANFEKNNPDIDLEIRPVAGGTAGLNEAVALGVATNTGPDIAYMATNVVGRWTHGGIHAGLADRIWTHGRIALRCSRFCLRASRSVVRCMRYHI